MQRSIAIGISLPKKVMEKIDVDRGDIPRSRYVLRILEKQYAFEGKNGIVNGSLDREFGILGSSKPLRP